MAARSLTLLLLLTYVAAWVATAWLSGQRGSAGFDLDRRGHSVLAAVSLVDVAAALLLTPLALIETFSRSSVPGRHRAGTAPSDLWRRAREGMGAIGTFVVVSTALSLVVWSRSSMVTGTSLFEARAITLAVCAAAATLALVNSAWFEDVHDAAGATYLALFAVAASLLFAAPLIATLSDASRLITTVLVTNPFVGVASATNFDLLRTDVLYRNLPFGQRLFEYPAWSAVAGIYLAAAACCLFCTLWLRSKEVPCD